MGAVGCVCGSARRRSNCISVQAMEEGEAEMPSTEAMQSQFQQAQQEEARKRQMEEQRHVVLSRFLTPEARERLARVRMVKPENAEMAENAIIRSVQQGRTRGGWMSGCCGICWRM